MVSSEPIVFLLRVCLIGCWITSCGGSHFRGAHFWWYPVDDVIETPIRIYLEFRVAWRRDYSVSTFCNQSNIDSGELMGPVDAGYIMCSKNCDFRVGNMDMRCTDFSVVEEWAAGVMRHTVELPNEGYYELSWRGRSWLEEVLHGDIVDWEFIVSMNIKRRTDTGKINSSPKSAAGTILRIQQECQQMLYIPVSDTDDDVVMCRWASGKECGGVCGAPDGMQLDASKCIITFNDNVKEGLHALAIQLEDFAPSDTQMTEPFSSVPLQFLIEIYNDSTTNGGSSGSGQTSCNRGPIFLEPTPVNEQCIPLQYGERKSIQILVRTPNELTSIREINTVSFIGLEKTDVIRSGNSLTDYYMNVTWSPEPNETGDRIFCFSAIDSSGFSTEQRCIYLSVGLTSPRATQVTYRDVVHEIVVTFDQNIQMPRESRDLEVFDATDQSILVLDTTNSDMVSYTENSLIANLDTSIRLNGQYYVKLQEGAVRGILRCGSDSLPVVNRTQLVFTGVTTIVPVSTPDIPEPTAAPSTDKKREYIWLIIVIVIILLLIALLIILAIVFRQRRNHAKSGEYARQQRQEEYLRNMQNSAPKTQIVGYDGPYAPNFHDIEVNW